MANTTHEKIKEIHNNTPLPLKFHSACLSSELGHLAFRLSAALAQKLRAIGGEEDNNAGFASNGKGYSRT